MTNRKNPCRAKNPIICPYHGSKTSSDLSTTDKLQLEIIASLGAEPAVVPVTFYRNRKCWIDFNKLNPAADHLFAHGECFIFALALHEKIGGELVVWDTPYSSEFAWNGHVAVQIAPCKYVDVNGVFDDKALVDNYEDPMIKQSFANMNDLKKHLVYWDFYVDDPFTAVGKEATAAVRNYASLVASQRLPVSSLA